MTAAPDVCDHGREDGDCVRCSQQRYLADDGRPRMVWTTARRHGTCRCRRAIFPGDRIGRDRQTDTPWLCRDCAQATSSTTATTTSRSDR